jgi:hypothetical protein
MAGRRASALIGVTLAGLAATLLGSPASAVVQPVAVTTSWATAGAPFHPTTDYYTSLETGPVDGARDGRALRLTMPAHPEAGAGGGAVIASDGLYRYGRFGTRIRTVDCTGQDHPGVVTGTFTYAPDHTDANGNGITDNSEIDIEILCAQPYVVYLSLWTDYDETGNDFREITRAVDLRTGTVLKNCYLRAWGRPCDPGLRGENTPARVKAVPKFDSATQFHTFAFDWQPGHVAFTVDDGAGHSVLLWNYHGPRSRIPGLPSALYQNVTYTKVWDPYDGVAHNQPTVAESAYVDSTFTPSTPVPPTPVPPTPVPPTPVSATPVSATPVSASRVPPAS